MTEQNLEPNTDPNADPDGSGESAVIKDLRKRAKAAEEAEAKAKAAEERAAKAEKELLFRKLGIDPSTGTGALFSDAYKGELTEDAMREAASKYGVLPQSSAPPEQVAAAQQVAAVGVGSEHTTTASDWESELAAIPQYGQPGWEQGTEKALALLEQHGGIVTRQRPKGQVTMFDVNGRRISPDQAAGARQ